MDLSKDFRQYLREIQKEQHRKHCRCSCDKCNASSDEEEPEEEIPSQPPLLWPTPLCDRCHGETTLVWDDLTDLGWIYEYAAIEDCFDYIKCETWKEELDKNRRITQFFRPREKPPKRRKITDFPSFSKLQDGTQRELRDGSHVQ